MCFVIHSRIDAFDYDETRGTISNRRNVLIIDNSLGVSCRLRPRVILIFFVDSVRYIIRSFVQEYKLVPANCQGNLGGYL